MRRLLLVVFVVALAGCSGVIPGADSGPPDGLGEVGNVSYDAELDVEPSAGLTETELDQFVNRSMARIEVVRELEFERPVDVTVINRSEYRTQYLDRVTGPTRPEWENQIWRGLFIIGADRNAADELDEALGGAVQGFYEPGQDSIVIVSDSETPTVRPVTLVHELTHALQDQQFGLFVGGETRDEQAAYDTLVEGEAELVSELYFERCGDWSCPDPGFSSGGRLEPGVAQVLLQPYTQGRQFVGRLRDEGGWEAVNEAHRNPPASTAQTITPGRYPVDTPRDVTVPDRSDPGWERFDQEPEADTLGAASIFSMFAANDVIQPDRPASYSHPVSNGWDGDQFVPYRNGTAFGYVWEIAWESGEDAERFAEAYRGLLEKNGGLERGLDTYVIDEGPYAGAYRLTRYGDTVQIVNGPSRGSLSEIHPP